MEDVQNLRTEVIQYSVVDDEIKRLNKELANAREQRSLIEDRITVLLASPQFVEYERLSVTTDNSIIKIKRPQQWEKPWSLARTSLLEYLEDYFRNEQRPTANTCYEYIILRNKKVATQFALERIAHKQE
jgi:hypothetical protein